MTGCQTAPLRRGPFTEVHSSTKSLSAAPAIHPEKDTRLFFFCLVLSEQISVCVNFTT